MKQAVTIVTHPMNRKYLRDLLIDLKYLDMPKYVIVNKGDYKDDYKNWILSFSDDYKIVFRDTGNYELGAIHHMYHNTDVDEFFLIQDTCRVEGYDFIHAMMKNKGTTVCITHRFQSYLGKYRREILDKIDIILPTNKKESIQFESNFNEEMYLANEDDYIILYPKNMEVGAPQVKYKGFNCIKIKYGELVKYKRVNGMNKLDRYLQEERKYL